MGETSPGPYLADGYKGMILVKAARKWESLYRQRLPLTSIQPLTVLQEILDDFFTSKRCSTGIPFFRYQTYVFCAVNQLSRHLRNGGFTIPFLKRMENHFLHVATQTETPKSLPLQLSPRQWAQHFLIDCFKCISGPYQMISLTGS